MKPNKLITYYILIKNFYLHRVWLNSRESKYTINKFHYTSIIKYSRKYLGVIYSRTQFLNYLHT